MGRLMLNILLSFAQYERENGAERVRDKVAASRKKGIWMGGFPPLGYDIKNRRLIVNEEEANLIRHIFHRFARIGSGTKLVKELNCDGYRTKTWTSKSTGTLHEGRDFDKGVLYRLLNNRVYLGEAVHKNKSYPGEHDAIITKKAWEKVHSILQRDQRKRSNMARDDSPALLKGILFCRHCGRAMTTSHTKKKGGKRYQYYLCMNASKNSYDSCPIRNVSAGEIDGIVFDRIKQLFQTPEVIVGTWKAASGLKEREVTKALKTVGPVWSELFPVERARIAQLLVSRVELSMEVVEVHLRLEGLDSLVQEMEDAA